MSDVCGAGDVFTTPKKRPGRRMESLATSDTLAAQDSYDQQGENGNTFKEKKGNNKVQAKEDTQISETTRDRKFLFRCYIPKRLIVTVLLGLGMLLVYAMRTNVGVTVVMILDEQAYAKVGTVDAIFNIPKVGWDSRMVGFLHSVFYIGFLVSQIPGAFFTTLLPSHKIYGGCILTSALLNLLLPLCIGRAAYILVCVVRCCQGLAEGLLYPACYGVLRHWTSPGERSRQVAAVLSCAYAGAILGFPMAGTITHYLGWQYIFYVSASCCVLWFLFWLCLSYEKPSHHKTMSDSEFQFLEKAQGLDVIDYENEFVPWRSILTSLPVIAICLCHFVRHWVFSLMLTNEPLYLNEFGYNIAETGALASVPHVAKVCLSFASGCIADALLNTKTLTTTAVRKLLVGLGLGIQTVGFIVLTFLQNGTSVIIVLTVTIGAFGLSTSGWSVNHYDLSTRYASSLVAVTSTVGTVGAIIVPLVTGSFTVEQTVESWDNVFYLTAAIVGVATVFYLIFGSGEPQSWSQPPAHICLVQKTDPLARKPYSTFTVQKNLSATNPGQLTPQDTGCCDTVKATPGYGGTDNKAAVSQKDGVTEAADRNTESEM